MWYDVRVGWVHLAVVVGIGLVAPLALRLPRAPWAAAAAGVALSFAIDRGAFAAVLSAPVVPLGLDGMRRVLVRNGPVLWWRRAEVTATIAGAWLLVATMNLPLSRLGAQPLGQHEPIVELATVHYLFAGVAALV